MQFVENFIHRLLVKTIRSGELTVTYASGVTHTYGDGNHEGAPGGASAFRFANNKAQWSMLFNPEMRLGENYMNGNVVLEKGNIFDLVSVIARNGPRKHMPWFPKLFMFGNFLANRVRNLWRSVTEKNDVAHHYDLTDELFDLFLDDDWQYTCAYYENPDLSLEEAQLAKKRHVVAKLRPKEDERVLEMGCGWGGLALYIAEMSGAHVTAVTLSENQVAIANKRAANRGLSDKTEFRLQNYRDVEGTFDRIVSVGMLEHVGKNYYSYMFSKSAQLLKKEGVMVVHSIGRPKPVLAQDGFNQKYIFPGGYIPAISEAVSAAEKAGFLIKDVEILPLHYAWTCRAWRERFVSNWDRAEKLYDARFCRMWEYYLAAAEVAFRHYRMMIFQLILTKHQDMVPYTRHYLAEETERLRSLEKTKLTTDKVEY